jgi:uncharacterized protein YkwD
VRLLALAVCCCAFAVLALPATSGAAAPPVIAKINAVRHAHGLPSLRFSRSLTRSSRRFGRHLSRTNTFQHAARIHASSKFGRLGEALGWAAGRKPRPGRQVRAWMHSAEHRSLLLSSSFRWVGAAHVKSRLGHRRSTIWVAQFGR